MRLTCRKLLSLLLVLAVALAPIRFGFAGTATGGVDTSSGDAVVQAMAGCEGLGSLDAGKFTADEGCPLMGDSVQDGEGCVGSDCDACTGAQTLTAREFTLPPIVSPTYLPSSPSRLADTPAAADFRPPRTLS